MTRHKGAKPVERRWADWGPNHPVARIISTGTHWLDAWTAQACVPWERLSKASGVPMGRILAIARGDRLTRAELEGFALAWRVDPAQVVASLADPLLLVE